MLWAHLEASCQPTHWRPAMPKRRKRPRAEGADLRVLWREPKRQRTQTAETTNTLQKGDDLVVATTVWTAFSIAILAVQAGWVKC